MIDMNWLHFLILTLAAFSINYLIINEISIYFSNKSYFSKWIILFILSLFLVLLNIYAPYSFTYLIALAITGGVEIIGNIITLNENQKNISPTIEQETNKISDVTDEMIKYHQNQLTSLENAKKNSSKNNNNDLLEPSSKINVGLQNPKIINSSRTYDTQDFLQESRGQNVTLSPFLRSNLDNSKGTNKK